MRNNPWHMSNGEWRMANETPVQFVTRHSSLVILAYLGGR